MSNNWTKEQKLAIDIKDKNILVSASAGSGKTAVLVERVISKVIDEHIDIDKILVVTFTNAAASELKQKLIKAINKEIKKDNQNYFLKRQLDNIHRASITTIHSFCLEVIRSNFFKIDLDPSFNICDDINSKLLKSAAMIKVLEDEYRNYVEGEFGIYNVLNIFNSKDDELLKTLDKIYNYIQSFEFPFEFLKLSIEKYNLDKKLDLCQSDFGKEIYNNVIDSLEIIVYKLKDLRNKVSDNLEDDLIKIVEVLDDDIANLERCTKCSDKSFDMLFSNVDNIEIKSMPRNRVRNVDLKDEVKNFRADILRAEIKNIKKTIYGKSEVIIEDLNKTYPYLIYIYKLIANIDAEYTKQKREKNLIDFGDIEHLALNILLTKTDSGYIPSETAIIYRNKFKEIYTDEYQDTSFTQEAILNSIAKTNNRFMVGDIKQSIYRFRQAMPEIFNSKYRAYINYEEINEDEMTVENTKVILAKNFRSRENVINSINYIFEKVMSYDLGDCDYEDKEVLQFGATRLKVNEANNYKTELNVLDTKLDEDSSMYEDIDDETLEYITELKNYEIEAKYIAKRVNDLVKKKEFKVYDEKEDTFRDIKYSDIVILLRGLKNKANILEDEFKSLEIPVFSDIETNIFDNDEIRLIISMLKIIDNPYQDIDMVAVLYSSIGKFTLDEIYMIKEYNKKEYIYDNLLLLSKETKDVNLKEHTLKFLNMLNSLIAFSKSYSVAELLNKIYTETNIYLESFLLNNSNSSKINLDSLVVVAQKLENPSIYTYVNYVQMLREKTVSETAKAKVIGENDNVVKIMTIHKSKGLEFPIVILSDTSNKYNIKDMSAPVTLNYEYGLGMNVINEELFITYPSIIKEAIKSKEAKTLKAEELRMLYVALTRAKEKLIIYGSVTDIQKKLSSMYIIKDENDKIDSKVIYKNTSFLDNILCTLKDYINVKENKDVVESLFDINIHKVKESSSISNILKNDITSNRLNDVLLSAYENKNEKEKLEIESMIEKLSYNINKKYHNENNLAVPSRISVSRLKEENRDDITLNNSNIHSLVNEDVIEYIDDEPIVNKEEKYAMPDCIKGKENVTSVRKGTLIHFILEHLDFNKVSTKKDISDFVNMLVKTGKIKEEEKKYINIKKICEFLNSNIGIRIKNSRKVFKEAEFVYKNNKYSKSIIQGVIDLYFENEDGSYTLVDFKTDNIIDKEEFVSRYKLQLDIYKDALAYINGYRIKNTYIYSFKLNDVIEVK